ncbi:hypothetical protein J6590_030534 [Homalodisca vitripennis]|nr:hypothetical protein J6590_030534 [Homalodisca vitripennis]
MSLISDQNASHGGQSGIIAGKIQNILVKSPFDDRKHVSTDDERMIQGWKQLTVANTQ